MKNDVSVSSIKVEPAVYDKSLAFTALGIIMKAMRRGATFADMDLWQSYLYLYDCLKKAVLGEELQGVEFPSFFWELLAALGPKKPWFKVAHLELTGNVIKNDTVPYTTSTTFQYDVLLAQNWYMAISTPSVDMVNGFVLLQTASPAYDAAAGAAATTKLWNYVAGNQKLYTLQAYGVPLLKDNTSAYATVVVDRGRSPFGVGAIRTTLSSETFIQSPILAKFCPEAEPGDDEIGPGSRRGFYHFRPSAGGPAYLGYVASEFLDRRQFHNKMVPLFKDINFFRIFDRFSLLLCRIQEEALAITTQAPLPGYPLTSQQAALMLRSVMMRICCNDAAFDVDNAEEPELDEAPFFPMAVGSATPFLGVLQSPLLPSFFAENLRALKRRQYAIGGKNQAYGQYVVDYIPRLVDQRGIYLNQQYQWGENNNDLYTTDGTEVAINLIDGITMFNAAPRIAILEGTELGTIIDTHNNWIKLASSVITPLSTIGNEPAAPFWALLSMTTHVSTILLNTPEVQQVVQPTTPTTTGKTLVKKVSEKKLKKIGYTLSKRRLGAVPVSSNAFTSDRDATQGITSLMPTIAALWKYQSLMVLPERKLQTVTLESTTEFYKSVMLEPSWSKASVFAQALLFTENGLQITELQRAIAAANIDIKGQLAAPSEWEQDYAVLEKEHAGGFIGTIATMLGNAIGVPEVGRLVRTLDDNC